MSVESIDVLDVMAVAILGVVHRTKKVTKRGIPLPKVPDHKIKLIPDLRFQVSEGT